MKRGTMKKFVATAAFLAAALLPFTSTADDGRENKSRFSKEFTIAVIGDWPYANTAVSPPKRVLFDNANLLYESINADPEVSLVLHVGDIHSGSEPCTGAGLDPVPPGSIPTYNQSIFGFFEKFNPPFVYTPGDNEWTDCHKAKESTSGAPLNELAAVRNLFFPNPGMTLGVHNKHVSTQAFDFDRDHPQDAAFVENVLWEHRGVVFVTLNMPGSNNDGLPWSGNANKLAAPPFLDEPARVAEAAQRTLAGLRWLDKAFERAQDEHAKAMVIGLQADMWDPAAVVAGGDGLGNYTIFVQELAERAIRFGRPVLLFNGDSHVFGADKPLADPGTATGRIHNTAAVPNLTRITVQGSTTAPAEWLRLTIDPESPTVFSWVNVPYCKDPLSSCQ
jgi:Calcineurin-like phosphoesterase